MKISLEWISQYVDITDLGPDIIMDKLTMGCAEMEEKIEIHRRVEGIYAGKILSVKPVAGKEQLFLAEVDCGSKKYTTVCAAPNVKVNMKSFFAPAGAVITGNKVVKEIPEYGIVSQGILCSAKELDFSEFHEGIFEVPDAVPLGTHLKDIIPAADILLEVDNKSITHRPDLWGQYGFAREIAAIFHRPLKPLKLDDEAKYNGLPAYKIQIDDLENCPVYTCIELKSIEPAPSPLSIQWRLHALGQRSINILVDLTNYIMFEIGQPTHAFDGDKIKKIRVAQFGSTGSFVTLDGRINNMKPDDLMIWNEQEPVALAGIMGGQNTEVSSATKKLLLESANFKGSRIRRTVNRLGLSSEASQRFEKNQPQYNTRIAILRFLALLYEAGVPLQVTSAFSYTGNIGDQFRDLNIPIELFYKKIGMHIPEQTILEILHSLGFKAEITERLLKTRIPPFRSIPDISIPEDIVEEVARVYGYDNIEPVMPGTIIRPVAPNIFLSQQHKVRRFLSGVQNYIEIQSYAWYNDNWLKILEFDPGSTLVLKNPTAAFLSRLRTTLIPGLLAAVKQNAVLRDTLHLYEIGRVYQPGDCGVHTESTHLAGISYRQTREKDMDDHYRNCKGILEKLLQLVNFTPVRIETGTGETGDSGAFPWQMDKGFINIFCGDKKVGCLGILPDALLKKMNLNAQVVWFELYLNQFEGALYPVPVFTAPSIYPGSWQDFSLLWEANKGFKALQDVIKQFSHNLLMDTEFLYLYKGKGLAEGTGSYTFRFWFGSRERTITSDDINDFQNSFMAFLEKQAIKIR